MAAVLLGLLSAVLFGAMTPLLRLALRRSPDPQVGALATTTASLGVCAIAASIRHSGHVLDAWPFVLAGVAAPGASQIFFMRALRAAGPARSSVVVGTAPLFAVAIGLTILGEPLRAALVLGALFIVAGGVLLLGERIRPAEFRHVGLALAFACAILFASRDSFVRWFSDHTSVEPFLAATATAAGGALFLAAALAVTHRGRLRELPSGLPFVPAGTMIGLSYVALFEAYYRGRVSVVSPLVATESLWGVLFAGLVLGRSELIGRRLVGGAVMIVAGGALIGAFR